ncbi:50S ribosomal protein L19 [bacterium]|nr:50S ribosomal protein L19 [bacterium]
MWKFKGLVIKVKKPGCADGTFTIRGLAAGQTIEKVYPLSFPKFEKVLLLDEYKIRRSKLYYIREKIGKSARMKSKIAADKRDTDLLK